MKFSYQEFDLSRVKTYPLASRKSKANAADFAQAFKPGSGVPGLVDSLPSILAGGDFKAIVAALRTARDEGRGVYLNCGSAVVLPEVFLKAVALARNHGRPLDGLTTVNIDFVRQYRPITNVVSRPVAGTGKGYALVGHHEILIPLLAAALVE